ncbi:DUF6415 family natural product biosynthesis protein [Streptomyces sp. NBC_00996]|uniref:DUF6415 family natural product biosynthesis protein n=1 Tax=Streptomyces sp. NBC_00996 TaxID=2903710 RepID=UPI00386AF973|nr:DUF6415 family natural product biosynthesis protein [Streptomyces sp. NBC_00996]
MKNATADPPTVEDQGAPPPDLEAMRDAVNCLLDPDAVPEALPPAPEELDTLTLQLRGHVGLLVAEVEQMALRLPKDSIPRYCALACLGEAREKLRAQPGGGPHGALVYARRLARVLNALCDHHEALSGSPS